MTWFVTRRADGGIACAYEYAQPDLALEEMADDAPELRAFLQPSSGFSLYKTTIIARMTDAELDAFDTAMVSAPRRQRLMWEGCLSVESSSPFFPVLRDAMAQAFGAERADEILAP